MSDNEYMQTFLCWDESEGTEGDAISVVDVDVFDAAEQAAELMDMQDGVKPSRIIRIKDQAGTCDRMRVESELVRMYESCHLEVIK